MFQSAFSFLIICDLSTDWLLRLLHYSDSNSKWRCGSDMAGLRGSNSTSFSLPLLQMFGERKRSSHAESNGFPGNANLPDLVQQSHAPLTTPTEGPGHHSSLLGQDLDSVAEVGDSAACQSKPLCLLTSNSNPTLTFDLANHHHLVYSPK